MQRERDERARREREQRERVTRGDTLLRAALRPSSTSSLIIDTNEISKDGALQLGYILMTWLL